MNYEETGPEKLIPMMLVDFIRAFEASLDPRLWASLVEEEMNELAEALGGDDREHLLKETIDLMYVQNGFNLVAIGAEQMGLFNDKEHGEYMALLNKAANVWDKAMDKLGDVNLFEAFRRVHLSNMSKMGDDGLPLKSDDGKILKGPNYKEPNLKDLV